MSAHREHVLEGGGLAVRFVWRDGRFAHAISIVEERSGNSTVVLRSIEGTPSDAWPASPPFQSLHREGAPSERQLALLVGMAGKSHWSASVELDPAVPCICFDVACRVHPGESGPLGSRYRVGDAAGPDRSQQTIVLGTFAERQLAVAIDEDIGAGRLAVSDDSLRIDAVPQGPGTTAKTIRWRYTVRLARA